MTTRTHTLRFAGTAIAAVLASCSTLALAQENAPAAPTIVLPPVTATAPAAPAPAPVVAAPVVTPEPVAPPVAAEPAAEPAPRAPTSPRAAPAPRAAAVAQRASAPAATSEPAAPAAAAAPLAPTAVTPEIAAEPAQPVAEPVADTAPDEGGDNTLAIAGLAGLIALGGAGIFAATRRRRSVVTDEADYVYEPVAQPVAEPVSPPARLSQPAAPGAFASMAAPRTIAPRAPTSEEVPAGDVAVATRPAVTPAAAEPLELDDRQALLERMAAEEPSDENPFTSHKARMRRARLILQGREARGEPLDGAAGRVDLDRHVPAFSNRQLIDA